MQLPTLHVTRETNLAAELAILETQRIVYRELLLTNGNRLEVNRQIVWKDEKGQPYKLGPDLSSISSEAEVMFWSGELKGGADPAGSERALENSDAPL